MKLWTLIENTPAEGLAFEHGLSLYLESGGRRIVFDFGQGDAFLENARRMGIRPEAADLAVLSHGHYDHGGGLGAYLEAAPDMEVYVNQYAFGSHHRSDGSYIGLDRSLADHPRVRKVGEDVLLAPGVLLAQSSRPPWSSQGLTRREGERFLPEDFRHEQYLLIQEGDRRILVSGCAHRGAAVLLEQFRPHVFIGGLHSSHMDPEGPDFGELADALDRSGAKILTCHCTGRRQYDALKARLGDRIGCIPTGTALEF